jgi:hypothetical protein
MSINGKVLSTETETGDGVSDFLVAYSRGISPVSIRCPLTVGPEHCTTLLLCRPTRYFGASYDFSASERGHCKIRSPLPVTFERGRFSPLLLTQFKNEEPG